ncbi:hypothetical protein AVEN_116253-1 [Araneus ventricosus]|uniref:Uncharacterized protein n=1 Tax=Araneus ventricosus TaxID=182803 RepID=A0A4Y1ZSA9_ARAVE|nr:hypothetical protein AVEN_116253-1 [Araneus ventricosus]
MNLLRIQVAIAVFDEGREISLSLKEKLGPFIVFKGFLAPNVLGSRGVIDGQWSAAVVVLTSVRIVDPEEIAPSCPPYGLVGTIHCSTDDPYFHMFQQDGFPFRYPLHRILQHKQYR